jgi:hypothetical protein
MEPENICIIELTCPESRNVAGLVDEVMGASSAIPLLPFLNSAQVMAQELPRRLRREVYASRLAECHLAVCIRHSPWQSAAVPPTPLALRDSGIEELVSAVEVLHVLYASLFGESFGWSTIQSGYVVNDILPIPGHDDRPLSSSSTSTFGLHTEDAFQACAGDYLGLLCMRNPQQVATILAAPVIDELPPKLRAILFEPRFVVGANVAHRVADRATTLPILFGSEERPYFRINTNSMATPSNDPEAARALAAFVANLQSHVQEVGFAEGEYWYLDNYRVAHGRAAFTPSYDHFDRWLKRLYITSQFRASRAFRAQSESRLVRLRVS